MWLIRTKLEVPAPTGRLVSRQRLRRHLPSVLRARLALVHAPAGFGKTCLLAEWQRCLASQRVRTAWLSLDEDDSEPLQFMAYLTAALAAAGIDVGHLGPAAERGFPDVPVSSLVAVLNQAVQRSRGRTVVMLDDYHRLHGGAVDAVLVSLIQGLGSRVSFVIAARERPAFTHADRALRVTCIELAGDQLRFTLDETRALLERTGTVSEEAVQSIAKGTDGWAIALAAARDWLASGWSAERVRDALARPAADLNRYVADQILESLAPAERDFLRRTAIVDRFSEPLAHALCGDLPVHDAIAALERKDLLVVIWDGNERWFRYHRLIAELASGELSGAGEPAGSRIRERLHRRAAEWFFEAGHHAEAVRHALATGDDRLLAELFERAGGWQLIVTGHVGLTRNALTFIPHEVMRDYPRSQLARILMLAKSGRPDEAYREIERLRAMHLPSDDELLEMEVELMRVGVDRYGDRPCDEPYVARFQALFDRVPSDHTPLRAAFANMLCALQYERGELEAAFATGDEAVSQYRRMNSLFGEVFVYVHQGRTLHEMGRLRDATSTLRQAWALARDTTGPNTETEAVAAATLAAALYEHGDLEEAEGLLATALPALEQGESWFDVFAVAYETAAAIALDRAGPTAAHAIAQRAREMAARRDLARLARFADLIDLQSHIAAGVLDTPSVPVLEASLSVGLAMEVSPRLRLRMALALARLTLARGQARAARESAVRLAAECKASRHHRLGIHATLVEALAANSLGESESAASAFERAVNSAMHEGFQQVFRDFGKASRPLLPASRACPPSGRSYASSQAAKTTLFAAGNKADVRKKRRRRLFSNEPEQAGPSGFDAHAPRVRDRFLQSVHEGLGASAETSGRDILSDREREVLRLLAEGLSNKSIARALSVSDNTVKFHLKNLFTKLGVSTRTEAVHLAPSLSLPGARGR